MWNIKIVFCSLFDSESSTESEEAAALKRQLKAKKYQLKSLLTKPIFPKGFSSKYLDTNVSVDLPQNAEKAIEVMKKVIDNSDKNKKSNAASKKRQKPQKSKRFKKFKKA